MGQYTDLLLFLLQLLPEQLPNCSDGLLLRSICGNKIYPPINSQRKLEQQIFLTLKENNDDSTKYRVYEQNLDAIVNLRRGLWA